MSHTKTVLIISYYFPPMGLSGVIKTAKTAKYLAKAGWRVVVLTATPNQYYAYDDTLLEELIEAGVHIYSTPSKKQPKPGETSPLPGFVENTIIKPLQSQIYFPDPAIRWKRIALAAAEGIINEYNVSLLISVSPPLSNHVITDLIAEKFQIPFILDYQDEWTKGMTVDSTKKLKSTAHQKLENHLLNRTAKILVPSRLAKEQMIKEYRFLDHDDIMIFPAGFDPDDIKDIEINARAGDRFTIVHAGLVDDAGYFHDFLNAIKNFIVNTPEAQSKIKLSLPGIIAPKTSAIIEKLGLQSVIDSPGYIHHKALFATMKQATALLATTKSMYRIPSKMYEYAAIEKPLIVISPEHSAAYKMAMESGAGHCASPMNKGEIESMIRSLFYSWKSGTLPKVKPGFSSQYAITSTIEDLSIACTKAIRL